MFSHVMLGSNDLERSRTFYDALFGAVGGKPGFPIPGRDVIMYMHNGAMFMVSKPIDGNLATCANGGTIGFGVESPEQADAWHAAGVAAGGKAIEDPPGLRQLESGGGYYLAYLRDPDGNKLCAMRAVAA